MNHKPHRSHLEEPRRGFYYPDGERVVRPPVVTQCPHALWWNGWIRHWD